jgi:4-diphosphocytidyl-2-C-methyl-D-erythritol kinase
LRAVRRANPALAGTVDWMAIAAALGADVPVCLEDRPAFVWGAGEKLKAVPNLPRLQAVLVNPLAVVPLGKTARVFAGLNAPPADATRAEPRFPSRFADAAALTDYMRAQGNDLRAAAAKVVPEIVDVTAALSAAPRCLFTGLSGAGPTCYGIFATAEEAAAAAAGLRAGQLRWRVIPTALGG